MGRRWIVNAFVLLLAACATPDLAPTPDEGRDPGPADAIEPEALDDATDALEAPGTDPGDPFLDAPDGAPDAPGTTPDAGSDAADSLDEAGADPGTDPGEDPGNDDAATTDAPEVPAPTCLPWTANAPGDLLASAGDEMRLTMHHVRYKVDHGLFGDEWFDHADFPFWAATGHDASSRSAMFVSEPWRPDPSAVTAVVILAAGQQGLRQFPGANANIATGQTATWRPDGADTLADAEVRIRRESVAGRLLLDGLECSGARYGFTPGNTLVLLAHDAGFNYLLSVAHKQAAVDGYLDWLRGRVADPTQVRRVFVAGSSRGGCLALRLAQRLLSDPDYAAATVLVGTLDGVCQPEQDEGGTTSANPVPNPLHPGWFAYRTDLQGFLPAAAHGRVAVRQIVGGAPVIDLLLTGVAHAFVDTHVDEPAPAWSFDYQATWADLSHEEIGRFWHDEAAGALLDWLAARAPAP